MLQDRVEVLISGHLSGRSKFSEIISLVHGQKIIRSKTCNSGCLPVCYPKPGGLRISECTRMTHQTIIETALGKPFRVDIAESLRRGGMTCHFIVHLS